MEKENDIILVPCDFTVNADNSLAHAIQLASVAKNKIVLTYFHRKGLFRKPLTAEKQKEIIQKLTEISENVEKNYGIKPEVLIKEANGFIKSIKELVQSENVNLLIMAEHFNYGTTKLNTFNLINIFKNSRLKKNLSIIVIPGPPRHQHYVEIVVPINYQKEFKETLKWIMHLSKYYKCNINFIKPFYEDEEKKRKMANNMYFTKKMLDNNNIVYGIKTAKKQKIYGDEIFRFAKDIDADLIVIMADKYQEYILDVRKRNKENIDVPVMCIKPLPKKFQGFH
jgi:nucleotide-binding universal stress UspA family protein